MSFLRFASDEVLWMAGTLETSGGQMKSASKELKHADARQIGHSGLESACDDFAESWDYGFGELAKLTKGVSKFARKASDEFLGLDGKLSQELRKKRAEGGT
ncbi:hypothetical protein OG986_20040 [Streptomyces cellulosae]|uniref:hypothetical protein n=1 Tax=unclassified Streptomyces TaxID=2593676 RepID=UPI00109E5887|nr:hypothetical protein [Streptomyces sp. McG7]THC56922.1 hypothetical protein E7X38_12715 [Streptomyces sp. Akac8]